MRKSVEIDNGTVQQFVPWPAARTPTVCGCAIATTRPQSPKKSKRALGWMIAGLLSVLGCFGIARRSLVDRWVRHRPSAYWIEHRSAQSALTRLRIAQAEFSLAQIRNELLWSRRHRAWEEWTTLDATARAVYAALAGLPAPASPAEIVARLSLASGPDDRRWDMPEIRSALSRLCTYDAILRVAGDRFKPQKPDWALLPEIALPLAAIIARATPRIGNYRVAERIGVGATGEVFRAIRVCDGTQVALKMARRSERGNPETRRRLKQEGEIVSTLSHPNIVRLLERGEYDGRMYLAMELLPGTTLSERLAQSPALAPAAAIKILCGIAAALAAMHERGVIHRDLHPGNVMVLPDGSARLLDFGLAKAGTASGGTRAHTLMGSLPYMAPEVVAGLPADKSSDLFALGALAVEALSGRRLWQGAQTLELIVEIAHFEGPAPELLESMPPRLRGVLRALLSPLPEARLSAAATHAMLAESTAWI